MPLLGPMASFGWFVVFIFIFNTYFISEMFVIKGNHSRLTFNYFHESIFNPLLCMS